MIEKNDKVIVTVDKWFYAPDGKQYRAVYGTVKEIVRAENLIGVVPRPPSTNWYLEIGNMIIAGCQIHYVLKTDHCNKDSAVDWTSDAQHGCKEYLRPCAIYFADED